MTKKEKRSGGKSKIKMKRNPLKLKNTMIAKK